MLRHLEHIGSWNVDAGVDASQTHHTSIEPLLDQRGSIVWMGPIHFFWRKIVSINSKLIDTILKLTLASGIADRTVERVIDQ
jgi:hypothetical protein